MIDLHDLRERPEAYQEACQKKRVSFDVKAFLELDAQVRKMRTDLEGMRAEQNAVSKAIPKLQGAEKESKLAEMKQLAERLKGAQEEFKALEETWIKKQGQNCFYNSNVVNVVSLKWQPRTTLGCFKQ